MTLKFDITLTKSQKEMYDLAHDKVYRYLAFACSRQSGKSVLMKVLCCEWLVYPNNNIGYVCKNFVLAKKLYRDMVALLPKEIVKSNNGSDLIIESVSGSVLQFYSAEQGSSLRGSTFTYLICDEFAFFKEVLPDGSHIWNDILFPTVKMRGKKTIFVSTPLGKNNTFYEMYRRGQSQKHKIHASLKKTIYDDTLTSEEEVEEIRRSIPELSFRQEFMCEFLDNALTFFQGFEKCFTDTEYTSGNKQWVGVDLSGDGQDATIVTVINDRHQAVTHEVVGPLDLKYRRIAYIINSQPNLQAAYLESNGMGSAMINEIRKHVTHKSKLHEWTTTNATKEEIVTRLAVMIADEDIEIPNAEQALFDEMAVFQYTVTKSKKLAFAAKEGHHDDRVMSLCMAIRAMDDFKSTATNKNYMHIRDNGRLNIN